jgi:hypothetical protein
MIANALLSAGLVSLAAAGPISARDGAPHYPPLGSSKGFNLVVNVTQPGADFSPSIQNAFIASIHTGAGQALVGITSDIASSRIFYQNGTSEQYLNGQSNLISDGGTPPTPQGLQLNKEGTIATASMNFGPGSAGVRLTRTPEPYSFLLPETFVACNTSLAYYKGEYFITIKQAETTVGADGAINKNVPEGCAPIRLVPQCAELAALPADAYSSHEYALDSSCYQDVASIKWNEYGP